MSECSVTNLGDCVVEAFFNFIFSFVKTALQQFLFIIKDLMTDKINIEIFAGTWGTIVYALSLFYGLFLIIVGFQFILSEGSPEKREKAKSNLSKIFIMIFLVQISFFLYSLILEIGSSMTEVVWNSIPSNFFIFNSETFLGESLEFFLVLSYFTTLIVTLVFLSIRYLCVGVGVLFFCVGIFLYFIEPLESYGKLILNYLGVLIFLPFFYSIIILASSKLTESGIFENFGVLALIGCFSLINFITLFLVLFVVFKTANSISKPVSVITKLVN